MCKKLLLLGVVGLVGIGILRNTNIPSYLATAWKSGVDQLEESVDPQFELERIRYQLDGLDQDIAQAKDELASRIYQVRKLDQQVVSLEEELYGAHLVLKDRASKVDEVGDADKQERAKRRLQSDVNKYNARMRELDAKRQELKVQKRIRDAVHEQLDALVSQQDQWKSEIAQLEAEWKLVQLEQIESDYQNDDSRLADIKQSVNRLKKRIEQDRIRINLDEEYDPDAVRHKSGEEIVRGLRPPTPNGHENVNRND